MRYISITKNPYCFLLGNILAVLLVVGMTASASAASIKRTQVASTLVPISLQYDIGGLDLDTWCKHLGYGGVSLDGSTAYDWKCYISGGPHVGMDLNAACQWTYNNPTAFSRVLNFYDPYSWRCYTS